MGVPVAALEVLGAEDAVVQQVGASIFGTHSEFIFSVLSRNGFPAPGGSLTGADSLVPSAAACVLPCCRFHVLFPVLDRAGSACSCWRRSAQAPATRRSTLRGTHC